VPLTGDPDTDGMNIYQIDFLETAAWTKDLLLKMKHHEQLLKGDFGGCLYLRRAKNSNEEPFPKASGKNNLPRIPSPSSPTKHTPSTTLISQIRIRTRSTKRSRSASTSGSCWHITG